MGLSRKRSRSSAVVRLIFVYSALELWRNKFGLLLLVVIPALFLAVTVWTAGEGEIPIKLFLQAGTQNLMLSQRDISLIFMSAAVNGFLAAYYASLLFQRDFEYYRYCVSMGPKPTAFAVARFCFLVSIVLFLAGLVTAIVSGFTTLERPLVALAGYVLLGVVYGAYGGIVGLLNRNHMVAVLLVVLLANLDAGWLQNPVFYSSAQEDSLIRWLPAFHPCQLAFSAAFASESNGRAALLAAGYGLSLFGALIILVYLKLRRVARGP